MILVSACLLGDMCKYNGGHNKNEKVLKYLKDKEYIKICPEQLGRLSTPRNPSEIIGGSGEDVLDNKCRILSNTGIDVTENFKDGAYEVLKIAKENNCTSAILKDGSPSCGYTYIYDGSFDGNKIKGLGVTAAILKRQGLKIIDVKDL